MKRVPLEIAERALFSPLADRARNTHEPVIGRFRDSAFSEHEPVIGGQLIPAFSGSCMKCVRAGNRRTGRSGL